MQSTKQLSENPRNVYLIGVPVLSHDDNYQKDVIVEDDQYYPKIHKWIVEDNISEVRKFIGDMPTLMGQVDWAGRTPLHVAVLNKNIEIVDLLLKNGADTNVVDDDGNTPLHLAIFTDFPGMIDVLLRYTPRMDIQNKSGFTSLKLASIFPSLFEQSQSEPILGCSIF